MARPADSYRGARRNALRRYAGTITPALWRQALMRDARKTSGYADGTRYNSTVHHDTGAFAPIGKIFTSTIRRLFAMGS